MPARDRWAQEFKRFVIIGESTVQGGGWLADKSERYPDILARLISSCQSQPVEYYNKGIGANAISPRSPGYEKSAKPSALERYQQDVIALKPDLCVVAYGLNDMRAAMPVEEFKEDLSTMVRHIRQACAPFLVLTTVYHMTGWKRYPPYDKGSSSLTRRYNQAITEVASAASCVVADIWAGQGEADWLVHPDGVHANRVGNLIIAHRIFETIAQNASGIAWATQERDKDTDWARATSQQK